jgi:hypothetical protein
MAGLGRIKIFATGTHNTASVQKSWNLDDLKEIVEKTVSGAVRQIPLTLHHPKDDLPIFGYAAADTLKIEPDGDRHVLTIETGSFAQPFCEILRKAGLNKVSVGLAANKALKHIGLVDRPAVEGLGYVFTTRPAADGDTEYEFSEQQSLTTQKQKSMTEQEINALKEEKATLEAKFNAAELEKKRLTKEKSDADAALATTAANAAVEKFFSADDVKNRLTPKQEAHLSRLMKSLAGAAEYEFAAADGTTTKTSPLADLQAFIKTLPVIAGSERATEGNAFAAEGEKKKYASPKHEAVEKAKAAMAKKFAAAK